MDKMISTLMQACVITVDVDASIESVEKILHFHHLSCVPVVDATGRCFGIVSSTDIVHFHASNKDAKIERAWEICTHKIIEVGTGTSIKEAAQLMVAHNIHHLLVVEDDAIRGIVSSIDFIGEFLLKIAELQETD
ncbi:CBS domain-containing protein [Shewanella canadensis]|uniref:CBS domain-containing protein n=1 Tax=Shewanella canadensis TaxID=271096 RepID=A0A3S0LMD2_9GAMM|nr:CBS domain-containing protein [Shewanella canadensis]RTR38850.1 CBS domain-containing protein [Shewanella canadensis]